MTEIFTYLNATDTYYLRHRGINCTDLPSEMPAADSQNSALISLAWQHSGGYNICVKAVIGGKVRHKKRVFVHIFKKMSRNRKFLIVQGNFGKFIDVVRRNYVF